MSQLSVLYMMSKITSYYIFLSLQKTTSVLFTYDIIEVNNLSLFLSDLNNYILYLDKSQYIFLIKSTNIIGIVIFSNPIFIGVNCFKKYFLAKRNGFSNSI